MQKNRAERIVCILCLAVLLLFMLAIGLKAFTRLVLVRYLGMDNGFTRLVLFDNSAMQNDFDRRIDWEALYPFPAGIKEFEDAGLPDLQRLKAKVYSVEGKIETYATDHLYGYREMTELAREYEQLLQWNFTTYNEYNGVIEMEDGYLTGISGRLRDFTEHVDALAGLAAFCEGQGADFLYVQAPYKVCKYEDMGISGNVDFSNQNADELLKLLEKQEVNTYDIRESLHAEGLDHHAMFYRTDHHWKGETGLWAARHILQYLREAYGYDIDASVLDAERFTNVLYPEWFLGSQGKKVTLVAAEPEDFTLLYPDYKTKLHYAVPDLGIDAEGDFSVTYDMDCVDGIDYYGKNPYGAYTYGDRPLQSIENRNLENGVRLLMIGDSFDNCVFPFLSLGIQHVDSMDVRHFTGSVQSYVRETQPDIVLVVREPDSSLF